MFEAASELRTMNMGCSIRFGAGQPFFRQVNEIYSPVGRSSCSTVLVFRLWRRD